MTKICEFHTSYSSLLTMKLLHDKRQDGRPAFNFADLRQLPISFSCSEDKRNIRYLLQNAKLLEKLRLLYAADRSLVGVLCPSHGACTLKVLDLNLILFDCRFHSKPNRRASMR